MVPPRSYPLIVSHDLPFALRPQSTRQRSGSSAERHHALRSAVASSLSTSSRHPHYERTMNDRVLLGPGCGFGSGGLGGNRRQIARPIGLGATTPHAPAVEARVASGDADARARRGSNKDAAARQCRRARTQVSGNRDSVNYVCHVPYTRAFFPRMPFGQGNMALETTKHIGS